MRQPLAKVFLDPGSNTAFATFFPPRSTARKYIVVEDATVDSSNHAVVKSAWKRNTANDLPIFFSG
jgi:hypothetical protein